MNLGFSGTGGGTVLEEGLSRQSLVFNKESPLESLFSASVFDLPTDILSFHLNTGYMGGYINNHLSFVLPEVIAGRPFFDRLKEENIYANGSISGLSENISERVGLFLGGEIEEYDSGCLLYTSPSPRDRQKSRMPSSA